MKVIELLENDDWDVPAAPTADEDKIKHAVRLVQSLQDQLHIITRQIAKINHPGNNSALMAHLSKKEAQLNTELAQQRATFQKMGLKIVVIVVGKNKIPNPFVNCTNALYIGSPDKYPDLTTTQVKLYNEIQTALTKNGKLPLSILYGGRNANHNGINFVAVNPDSSFAWRKYDPSPWCRTKLGLYSRRWSTQDQ